MNVFLDTNVLLDVLMQRARFYLEAQKIWSLAERSVLSGFVSAISFNNSFCLVRKWGGPANARLGIRALRRVFAVVSLDQQILDQALESGTTDFEDSIQYFSALRAEAACIVTRNSDHFSKSALPVYTPTEFLAAHFPE